MLLSSRPLVAIAFIALAAVATGAVMLALAAVGRAADRPAWIFAVHAVSGVAAGAAALVALARLVPWGNRRLPAPAVAAALVFLLATAPWAATLKPVDPLPRYDPESYYRALTATNRRQAGDPWFPAGARPATEAEEASCTAGGCHAREAAEQRASHHAAATSSPYYRFAAAAYARDSSDRQALWCQGCHGTSSAGVGCVACHGIRELTSLTGNGRCLRGARPLPVPSGARSGFSGWLSGLAVRLRPRAHRDALAPGAIETRSEFCAPCHRMGISVAQNHYKFLRAEDEYGAWQNSASSGNSLHGFDPPRAAPLTCQSCHMPHRSHACPGTPTGRPPGVTLDLFAPGAGDHRAVAAPLAPAASGVKEKSGAGVVPRAADVRIDVVVANHGVGHDFPAGVTDAKETWLELTVEDAGRGGAPLFRSGAMGRDGEIDPAAHRYGLVALDRDGRRIERNDLHRMVTPLYNHAIAPGEADVVRYRFRVPDGARGPLRIRARLWERAASVAFHRAVFASRRDAPLPALRLVAEAEGYIGAGADARPAPSRSLATRCYDYGIGLLLRSDLPGAAAAMRRVQERAPDEVAGYLGLGRVYLQEGDLLAARSQLELARQLPGAARDRDARPDAFLATIYRRTGDYDRALSLLEPLAARYPRDRQLLFDIGIAHYRSGRNDKAAEAFRRILDVDPDDVSGHYNLMLCLQRLNRLPEARREETIYHYLKEDETVSDLIGSYLRSHPDDQREFLANHEHVLR